MTEDFNYEMSAGEYADALGVSFDAARQARERGDADADEIGVAAGRERAQEYAELAQWRQARDNMAALVRQLEDIGKLQDSFEARQHLAVANANVQRLEVALDLD